MQHMPFFADMVPSEEEGWLYQEAVAWVIRLHNDNVTAEDRRMFDAWHAQNLAHALMFWNVFSVWDCLELREAAVSYRELG